MVTWTRPRLYPNLKRIPRVLTIIIYSRDSTFVIHTLCCAADFTVRFRSVSIQQFLGFISTFCCPTDDESDSDAEEEQEKTVSCAHTRSCSDFTKHPLFWHLTVPQLSLFSFCGRYWSFPAFSCFHLPFDRNGGEQLPAASWMTKDGRCWKGTLCLSA